MVYYLLVCRSLTHAQQIMHVLDKSGISTRVLRTPKNVDRDGCGYSVKIDANQKQNAINILLASKMTIKKIYEINMDGSFQEVRQ